jgi:hypothetical protein
MLFPRTNHFLVAYNEAVLAGRFSTADFLRPLLDRRLLPIAPPERDRDAFATAGSFHHDHTEET